MNDVAVKTSLRALIGRTFETIDYDTRRVEALEPAITPEWAPLNLFPLTMRPSIPTPTQRREPDSSDDPDIFVQYDTHGAPCRLDNCANVTLRPSPSLHSFMIHNFLINQF